MCRCRIFHIPKTLELFRHLNSHLHMSYVSYIESLEIQHHICGFTKYVLTLKTEACVLVTKIREQCLGFCLKW